jgi:hypothetical protein
VTNLASSIGSLSTCFFTYLAAGEPTLAEKSYRWIINGRFLNSEAGEFQLSWLGSDVLLPLKAIALPCQLVINRRVAYRAVTGNQKSASVSEVLWLRSADRQLS